MLRLEDGYYAQAHSGQKFDGGQLLAVKDDVVASGAIFEPAVMPVGAQSCRRDRAESCRRLPGPDAGRSEPGRQHLQRHVRRSALCALLIDRRKQFTDAGVETRLRFAHECKCVVALPALR